MTDRTHVTLRVALDPQDGSIAGCVLDAAGAGRSFAGWMGRAAAIEDQQSSNLGRKVSGYVVDHFFQQKQR